MAHDTGIRDGGHSSTNTRAGRRAGGQELTKLSPDSNPQRMGKKDFILKAERTRSRRLRHIGNLHLENSFTLLISARI